MRILHVPSAIAILILFAAPVALSATSIAKPIVTPTLVAVGADLEYEITICNDTPSAVYLVLSDSPSIIIDHTSCFFTFTTKANGLVYYYDYDPIIRHLSPNESTTIIWHVPIKTFLDNSCEEASILFNIAYLNEVPPSYPNITVQYVAEHQRIAESQYVDYP